MEYLKYGIKDDGSPDVHKEWIEYLKHGIKESSRIEKKRQTGIQNRVNTPETTYGQDSE